MSELTKNKKKRKRPQDLLLAPSVSHEREPDPEPRHGLSQVPRGARAAHRDVFQGRVLQLLGSGSRHARRERLDSGASPASAAAHPRAPATAPAKGLGEPAAGVAPAGSAASDASGELLVMRMRGGARIVARRHRGRDRPEARGPRREQQGRGRRRGSVHLLLLEVMVQGPGYQGDASVVYASRCRRHRR